MNRKLPAVLALLATTAFAQNPFNGAVPDPQAQASASALTLQEAIRLGLKNNLGALLSDENSRAARGQRLLALSQLLPKVDARLQQASIQSNLAAFGFDSFPGINPIVGPFSLFDARASLSQAVLNLQSLHRSRAGEENLRAALLDSQDARDTVVLVVTALYLDAAAGASRIEAAEARAASAKALYDQAVSFKASGVVPGIDVLRADVQWRAQRQRLIAYRNEFEKQKLRLARAIGLPDGAALQLSGAMPAADSAALPKSAEALALALATRMDYRGMLSHVKAAELQRRAASDGRLPTVGFAADYGAIGKAPNSSHGTYTVGVVAQMPLFDGGRVKGEELQADAALGRARAQLAELRSRIEYEIRSAELDLQAANDQLEVARGSAGLARTQQEQARDRFAAGVTSNLEVVQAQEAVATADENLIASLLASNLAKAALARAIGASEKNIPAFLAGAR
jgi:outer membrane protein TolC